MIESPAPVCPAVPRFTPLSSKILNAHLERLAIVYVRQSSSKQVEENIESTQMQYQLVDRAAALGWPRPRIEVIDDDLGKREQSADGRPDFQRVLADVAATFFVCCDIRVTDGRRRSC